MSAGAGVGQSRHTVLQASAPPDGEQRSALRADGCAIARAETTKIGSRLRLSFAVQSPRVRRRCCRGLLQQPRSDFVECVEPLARADGIRVYVVDNDSSDGSLESVADLDLVGIPSGNNGGFSFGCNIGIRRGSSPFVLLLNPDASISAESLGDLVRILREDPRIGAVAPQIVHSDGAIDHSQRRFREYSPPSHKRCFSTGCSRGLHGSTKSFRDERLYEEFRPAEWVSGACVLVRREALADIGNLDETFFLYSEDTDLCRRLWEAGYGVWYVPSVTAVHEGGASAPRASLIAVLTESRRRYARKHHGRVVAALHTAGIALGALTHVAVCRGGAQARAGWLRALATAIRPINSAIGLVQPSATRG